MARADSESATALNMAHCLAHNTAKVEQSMDSLP